MTGHVVELATESSVIMSVAQAPFDGRKLADLLAMAGPAMSVDLMARLEDDLGKVALALADEAPILDRPKLAAQSHVLLAIAGTIGADHLHAEAKALNHLAKGEDGPELRACLDRTRQLLRLTRDQVSALRGQHKSPP